jgi:hypothetical protein
VKNVELIGDTTFVRYKPADRARLAPGRGHGYGAVVPLLPVFIAGPRIAHAGEEPESGAAMAARVSPEVARVVTVRPRNNDEPNSGAKVANATATERMARVRPWTFA